jgi:hypothetical protein
MQNTKAISSDTSYSHMIYSCFQKNYYNAPVLKFELDSHSRLVLGTADSFFTVDFAPSNGYKQLDSLYSLPAHSSRAQLLVASGPFPTAPQPMRFWFFYLQNRTCCPRPAFLPFIPLSAHHLLHSSVAIPSVASRHSYLILTTILFSSPLHRSLHLQRSC